MTTAQRSAVPGFLRAFARRALPAALAAACLVAGATTPARASTTDGATIASPASVSARLDGTAPRDAASPAATAETPVALTVSPAAQGVVQPDGDLVVQVTVENRTTTAFEAANATLFLRDDPFDTRTAIDAWFASPTSGDDAGRQVATVAVPRIGAGDNAVVTFTAPAAATRITGTTAFAPRGIAVSYAANGQSATERSAIVVAAPTTASATNVQVVVPIRGPLSGDGLMSARDLSAATGEGGSLARLLDAVDGTSATLAIDPRLLVSIRILGSGAPESATAWLERLESLPNKTFELPFADADLTLESQAGLAEPLRPTGFDYAARDENFRPTESPSPTPTASGTPTATGTAGTANPGASSPAGTGTASPEPSPGETADGGGADGAEPTPTPTGDPNAPKLPTLAELTAFPYKLTGVVWPGAGTANANDLLRLSTWGYSQAILTPEAVARDTPSPYTTSSSATVNGWTAATTDGVLDRVFQDAVASDSTAAYGSSMAHLSAVLATVTRELPYEPRTVLVTAGRGDIADPARLGAALRELDALSWADSVPLAFQNPGADVPTGVLVSTGHSPEAVERFRSVLESGARADAFATMYDRPERFRERIRAGLLASISVGWGVDTVQAAQMQNGFVGSVAAIEATVSLSNTSEIQVVGRESQVPVFVANSGDERVTVHVGLKPSTGKLEAGEPVTITIEPGSMTRALIQVKAIGNGETSALVFVTTPDGVPLSTTRTVNVNVNAEWELYAVIAGAVLLVALFVAGIVRTVRRRRGGAGGSSDTGGAAPDDDSPAPIAEAPDVGSSADPDAEASVAEQPTGGGASAGTAESSGPERPAGPEPEPGPTDAEPIGRASEPDEPGPERDPGAPDAPDAPGPREPRPDDEPDEPGREA